MQVQMGFAEAGAACLAAAAFLLLLSAGGAQAQAEDPGCLRSCVEEGRGCLGVGAADHRLCLRACQTQLKAAVLDCRQSSDRRACLAEARGLGEQCLANCVDDSPALAQHCTAVGFDCATACGIANAACVKQCATDFLACAEPLSASIKACDRECGAPTADRLRACRTDPDRIRCARDLWGQTRACIDGCRGDARANLGTCLDGAVACGRACLAP